MKILRLLLLVAFITPAIAMSADICCAAPAMQISADPCGDDTHFDSAADSCHDDACADCTLCHTQSFSPTLTVTSVRTREHSYTSLRFISSADIVSTVLTPPPTR